MPLAEEGTMQDISVYRQNKKELCADVSAQLQRLRAECGLSIESLSVRTGISVKNLTTIERGHLYELDHLCRLARFYHKKIRLTFY